MSDNAIECRNVCKEYKGTLALAGLNLAIAKGSIFGLLGKNGAGKTTLLKCLMGMQSYQSGSIEVLQAAPANLTAATKARIGYVPQQVMLYPWMKVRGLTDYIGSFYPRWNDALVSRLLTEWELKPEVKVGTLSVGQAQKLAIILALGHEPGLLILDEPAASLDPAARRQFLKTILDISGNEERTVLFSTHITSDIERVADSIGILREGRTIYAGELGALKDSVKKLRVTARAALPAKLEDRDIIAQEIRGNEGILTVRDFSQDFLPRLKARYGVEAEVIDVNLEDIFLSLNQ